ncbi:MobF family relaxase [Halostreptopolyspora alba]|uniref:TrwC relaxase domain-containing protein n=1 Tax=Halostreptopolyspora alba TaxID=2487137 RepID=A0A3N0DYZ8_9ACTN|nr:hypothetical protein EFW17_22605 [Nocardiopsaceae bacterium YIM 96095]
MAMVTVLGPDASQVDYRLSPTCGHDDATAGDAALTYRLAVATGARPIERIGGGWSEFGHAPGPDSVLVEDADVDAVRQVMAGRAPNSGEWLVKPKMAVHPNAKLPARPLVEAIQQTAAEAGHPAHDLLPPEQAKRLGRLERGLVRDGEAHRAPVGDLEVLAAAAGVDITGVYERQELAEAQAHRDERVRVGNRGYDVTIDVPKSVSVLWGLADEPTAARIEELYLQAVRESVSALESWTAYGMTGHHGDGQTAATVATSGYTGTITLHRTARPVAGQAGDPHIHAHVMLANLVRCEDGQWRTVAAGGRDLHRHVAAVGELARARVRDLLTRELGVAWEQSPETGRWEIVGIGADVRALYSQRRAQITAEAGTDASNAERDTIARRSAGAKLDLSPAEERQAWRERAETAHLDPDQLFADAIGHEPPEARTDRDPPGPRPPERPDPDTVAATVWDPEHGVTAGTKIVSRAKVMAAVANACPEGLASGQELAELTDAVLASGQPVAMPEAGQSHMANATRYTTRDVLEAEQTVIDAAARRRDTGAAAVAQASAAAAIAAYQQRKGITLSAEQRGVVERLLTAGHGIDAVVGVAGSGKTTIMAAARTGWEAQGLRVAGASTAAVAAAGLRAEAGIDARTIASWTQRIERGHGLSEVDVLVLDEAAMVDDGALAQLTEAAERSGTKLVGIGDPQQLRAVGVGGSFARVHEVVGGLTLSENRRQRGGVDRAALATWRQGAHQSALTTWGQAGRVHVGGDAEDAHAAIAAAWWADRQPISDPHDAVNDVLVLAATNRDVEELNARCRAIARDRGLLGEDVTYRTAGGDTLSLAVGDQIRVRRNDYRSRHSDEPDVLNGYRGTVRQTDQRQGALVEWRHDGRTEQAWMDPEDIAAGDLTHAYAATIASAQGQTCERAHVYGTGADARALYPAMSRARGESHLYLPGLEELESSGQHAAVGPPRTPEEEQARAIAAYATTLRDADEPIALDEITGAPYGLDQEPEHPHRAEPPAAEAERDQKAERNQQSPPAEHSQEAARDQERDRAPSAEEDTWQPLTRRAAYAGQGPAAAAAREEIAANQAALQAAQDRLPALRNAYVAAEERAEQSRLTLWMAGSSRRQAEAERDQARAELDETRAEVTRRSQEGTGLWQRAIQDDLQRAIREEHEAELRDQERVLGLSREELEARPMEERRAEVAGIRARDAGQSHIPVRPCGQHQRQAEEHARGAQPAEQRRREVAREREGPELGL